MHIIYSIVIISSLFLHALSSAALHEQSTQGHRFLAGPEIYHVRRTREGGTKQTGYLFGGKMLYDHIKRYKFYWAAEASYARGPLCGHTGQKKKIRSCLSESLIEGRFGYTFQTKKWLRPAFTPFAGAGYFWETNRYSKSSPLPIHTQIAYRYVTGGFLASLTWNKTWQAGVTLKLRYMLNPRCKITHDPEYKKISLKVGNDKFQYRIEFPLNYYSGCQYALPHCCYGFSVIPFYERFCYERQSAYPFDFLKTQFSNYGATLSGFYYF